MLLNFIISAKALFASAICNVVDVADLKIVNIPFHLHFDQVKRRQGKTTLHQNPEKLKLAVQQLLFPIYIYPIKFLWYFCLLDL